MKIASKILIIISVVALILLGDFVIIYRETSYLNRSVTEIERCLLRALNATQQSSTALNELRQLLPSGTNAHRADLRPPADWAQREQRAATAFAQLHGSLHEVAESLHLLPEDDSAVPARTLQTRLDDTRQACAALQSRWDEYAALDRGLSPAASQFADRTLRPTFSTDVEPALSRLRLALEQKLSLSVGRLSELTLASRQRSLLLALGLLVLLGLTACGAYRGILRPLREMEAVVKNYQAGNRRVHFGYKQRDELGALANAFNDMLDSLHASMVSRDELERIVRERTAEAQASRERVATSLTRLDLALEASMTCTWEVDLARNWIVLDPRWSQMLGGAHQQTEGSIRAQLHFVHPEDRAAVLHQTKAGAQGETSEFRIEFRVRHRDGHWLWLFSHGRVIETDERGHATRLIGTNTDITRRKVDEQALASEIDFLAALHATSVDFLNRNDLDSLLQSVIERATALLDAAFGELMLVEGNTLVVRAQTSQKIHTLGARYSRPEARLSWRAHDTQQPVVVADYGQVAEPAPFYAPLGLQAVAEFPIMERRKCVGVISLARVQPGHTFTVGDIQRGMLLAQMASLMLHKAAIYDEAVQEAASRNSALRESEERYRVLFDQSPLPVVVTAVPDGRIIDINPASIVAFGFTQSKPIVGHTTVETNLWVHAADREFFIRQLQTRGQVDQFEAPLRRADGEPLLCSIRSRLITVAGRQYALTLLADITESKRAETALRESEARFRTLSEVSPAGIFSTDANGAYTFVNHRWCELTGLTSAQALGDGWQAALHPEDKTAVLAAWQQSTRNQRPFFAEFRFRRPDGHVAWVLGQSRALHAIDGQVTGYVGTVTDLTATKQAESERHKTEALLRQSQKMESLGTLAGGIAHDFNNLLTGILGHTELARLEIPAGHPARGSLDQVLSVSQRARDLVSQILAFSRASDEQMLDLDLGEAVREATRLLRSTLPPKVDIQIKIEPGCPPVRADRTQIHQVVLNLGTNAWHALPSEGGRLELHLAQCIVEEGFHPELTAGPYLRLSVADNGCGMDAATLERIFEPFFTTKPTGQGTGLGLAVVHGIMQAHRGTILVSSAPGVGTTFELYFPARPAAIAAPHVAPTGETPRGAGQRVLVVDDQAAPGVVLERYLIALGYHPLRHESPSRALEEFRAHATSFDLMLVDHAMPGMTGTELVQQVRTLRPDLPVVMISGYLSDEDYRLAQAAGVSAFLPKPVMLATLAHSVAAVLATPARKGPG